MDFSWWWLFGGSFFDALIGPNLVVPGEPFFLAAGYQLNQGFIAGTIAVLIGAVLGDQLSFLIGHKMGAKGQRKLRRRFPKTRRAIAKAKVALTRYGFIIVIAARLLGPIAWVMPFMAGSYRMPWWKFSLCSLIGIALGVGQFLLAGALMGHGLSMLPSVTNLLLFLQEHWLLILTCVFGLIATVIFYRRQQGKWRNIVSTWIISLLLMNYVHFFINANSIGFALINASYAQTTASDDEDLQVTEIDHYAQLNFEVYPGLAPVYQAQPINLIYVGNNPDSLMQQLGWKKNKTFSSDNISLGHYFDLIQMKQPPISDLYWNQQPQWSAYQLAGDLLKRSHVRWWYGGIDKRSQQPLWVGAVSYDNSLKIAHYKGIITILHAIDPDVDEERDRLIKYSLKAGWHATKESLLIPQAFSKNQHYFSDGKVAIIQNYCGVANTCVQ
ncbi:LssY C-terminal domain-containing protein [Photobacterium sanguinicancri]|uniref:LssY C-terminal domain-containing protein n=1 Tax=Photobacterium sanguinicancri TaxID=875932 RepID=A0AAW7Y400_9GAMM|nr:LssY C-terminal domain-containing protein [Photobacterium sanguinicancri]MDO6542159.1 LssY C-terminal domain-containing protein [Photobacterium sanguinicancri]